MIYFWLEKTNKLLFLPTQAVKDVNEIRRIVQNVFHSSTTLPPCEGYDEEYKVHMAVVTANIGKRVDVSGLNLMSQTLKKIMQENGGRVEMLTRTDEVNTDS